VRTRLRFTKLGRIRWTGHRDVARVFERALRRAGLPVAYSAGFSPHPLISFGLALPTGCESVAEYLDVTFGEPVDPEAVTERLSCGLPEGIRVVAAAVVVPGTPSLQEDVTSCTWEIEVPGAGTEALAEAADRVLAADSLFVQRMRKGRLDTDDVRPAIRAVHARNGDDAAGSVLECELATRPRGVRPTDLAHALGLALGRARRTSQWIERDGSRWEPLAAAAAIAARVTEGAA